MNITSAKSRINTSRFVFVNLKFSSYASFKSIDKNVRSISPTTAIVGRNGKSPAMMYMPVLKFIKTALTPQNAITAAKTYNGGTYAVTAPHSAPKPKKTAPQKRVVLTFFALCSRSMPK